MAFDDGALLRAALTASYPATGTLEVNTLHYNLDFGGSPFEGDIHDPMQSLADTLRDDVRPHFAALYDSGWSIGPVVVYQERDPLHPAAARAEVQSGAAIAGTHAGLAGGTTLPPAMCAVATLKTSHIGRRNTGRMFLGGTLGEDQQDGGTWGATQLGLWQALLDSIPHQPDVIEGPGPESCNWCVYSRTSRGQSVTPYADSITSTILRTRVHWLRSRET